MGSLNHPNESRRHEAPNECSGVHEDENVQWTRSSARADPQNIAPLSRKQVAILRPSNMLSGMSVNGTMTTQEYDQSHQQTECYRPVYYYPAPVCQFDDGS